MPVAKLCTPLHCRATPSLPPNSQPANFQPTSRHPRQADLASVQQPSGEVVLHQPTAHVGRHTAQPGRRRPEPRGAPRWRGGEGGFSGKTTSAVPSDAGCVLEATRSFELAISRACRRRTELDKGKEERRGGRRKRQLRWSLGSRSGPPSPLAAEQRRRLGSRHGEVWVVELCRPLVARTDNAGRQTRRNHYLSYLKVDFRITVLDINYKGDGGRRGTGWCSTDSNNQICRLLI